MIKALNEAFLAVMNDKDAREQMYIEEGDDIELESQTVLSVLQDVDKKILTKHDIEVVHEDGGQHDGQDWFFIVKLNGKLYKIPGYYSSWDSSEMNIEEAAEVESYQEMVTFYRPISKKKK